MPILKNLPIKVEIDQVLAAQGLNPPLIREKKPKLIELTEQAIAVGLPYLEPCAVIERYSVIRVLHDRLELENGQFLQSKLIIDNIASASLIVAAVCTIGGKIDELVSDVFSQKPALALAIEGFASAATEILGNSVCSYIDANLTTNGMRTSNPFNPGMIGWPVEEGQPQIFSLLNPAEIGVHLEPTGLMKPLKSMSFVIGIGTDFDQRIQLCDLCTLKKTCIQRQAKMGIN